MADATIVTDRVVACDGGGTALGHPRVFLKIGESGEVECPYCSRRYRLDKSRAAAPSH